MILLPEEVIPICLSCNCRDYRSKHDEASIDWHDLQAAADDAGIAPHQAAWNIVRGARAMAENDEAAEKMAENMTVVKSNDEQRFLLMVGYSPNRLPRKGADGFLDTISPALAEKACWRFMLNGAGAGLMHKSGGENAFRVVENYVYRNDEPWILKAADGSTQTIRKGDWLIGVIATPEVFADFKAGKYGSGSIQGSASRRRATPETLARQRSE